MIVLPRETLLATARRHIDETSFAPRSYSMVQHAESNLTPPSQRSDQPIPPALDCVVMACLEKDPAKRPQRADDLADALARSLDAHPGSRRPHSCCTRETKHAFRSKKDAC